VRLHSYENLTPFGEGRDFYTATRVYPAEPTVHSALLRVVASSDTEAVQRLTRLAPVVHELESSHFPPLRDMGMTDEYWYMAFHVQAPLRRSPFPGLDPLAFVRHLAKALAYLHDHELAHRALTPGRIALDSSGTPLLFDLWWLGHLGADRRVRTVLDRRPRTPYDAPESSEAEFDGVSADIYSLGVLAGVLQLPAGYAHLVTRMTRPSPRERPASMHAVIGELG
jgi:serine/threonine protein kinase